MWIDDDDDFEEVDPRSKRGSSKTETSSSQKRQKTTGGDEIHPVILAENVPLAEAEKEPVIELDGQLDLLHDTNMDGALASYYTAFGEDFHPRSADALCQFLVAARRDILQLRDNPAYESEKKRTEELQKRIHELTTQLRKRDGYVLHLERKVKKLEQQLDEAVAFPSHHGSA